MPELSGLEATRRIRRLLPRTEVLVLSLHYSDELVRKVVDAGARGYVLKSDASKDLVRAIKAVANHQPYFTSSANEVLIKGVSDQNLEAASSVSAYNTLTGREREIVQLLAEGQSSKERSRHARDQFQDGRNAPHQCYAQAGSAFGDRIGALRSQTSHDRALKMGKRVFPYWSALRQSSSRSAWLTTGVCFSSKACNTW